MHLVDVAVEIFWRLAAAEKIRDSLDRQLVIANQNHRAVEDQFLIGEVAEIDLYRSKKHLLDLQVEFDRAKLDVEQGKQQLLSLLNVSKAAGISTQFKLDHKDVGKLFFGDTEQEMLTFAKANSPALQIAKKGQDRALEEYRRTKNHAQPQVDFVVSTWRANINDDKISREQMFDNDYESWQAGLEVTVPILGGVQQRSAKSIARYRYQQSQLQYQATMNDIEMQINTGLDTVQRLASQSQASYNAYLERKKMTEDLARLSEYGEIQIGTLIDQQQQEFADWRRYIGYSVEAKIAQSKLDLATGTILQRYYPDYMNMLKQDIPQHFNLTKDVFR